MLSLTYVSSATEPMPEPKLVELLETIRPKNQARAVTGMLLYSGGNFIQVLEGPADAVRATYAEITTDPRHRGQIVVLEEEIEERAFPEWSMGFRNIGEVAGLEGYTDYLRDPDGTPIGPGFAATILQTFRESMR